jgi:flagellar hook-associated protein 2
VEKNIRGFVDAFNATKLKIDELTDRETEAALRSDSSVKRLLRDVRNIMTNVSSSPGDQITRLSDIGISINKVGTFEVDDAKLSAGMTGQLADVAKVFSANTSGQTEIGVAARGVAGDMSKLINDFNGPSGYTATKTTTLNERISEKREELDELENRIAKLQTRYERQFAAMQQVIDEMNNTRDNLITSFENLPFTAEK